MTETSDKFAARKRSPQAAPRLHRDGTMTAANASNINDGAAALLLASASRAAALGRRRWPASSATAPSPGARVVHHRAGRRDRHRARAAGLDRGISTCGRSTRLSRSWPWRSMHELGARTTRSTCAAARWRWAIRSAPPGARILVTLFTPCRRGARRGWPLSASAVARPPHGGGAPLPRSAHGPRAAGDARRSPGAVRRAARP